ncbi:MAG: 4-(cytidine 5'-diphospho)-2-C-methyl-D-erythritol kinase [Planctomycetes bacterium]|nr:4-(cytidine 5'-diphospho)-2-C-methyl-D-erythritol kinase [Planctomycetota bacterium]
MERLAHAKLNWDLHILGKRPDGFHELDSVMVSIALADRLRFEPAETLRFTCTDPSLPADDTNLVVKAAKRLAEAAGVPARAAIHLEKHVPAGGGLGGGSSDAACTLEALNELWGLHWPRERLAEVAAHLGSDVAFFLWGGWCQCLGRGERIERLPEIPETEAPVFFLVIPPFGIPTPLVYKVLKAPAWSDKRPARSLTEVSDNIRMQLVKLYKNDPMPDWPHNGLQEAARVAEPRLVELHQWLDATVPGRWQLSGSGAVHFVVSSPVDAAAVSRKLESNLPEKVRLIRIQGTTGGW